MIHSVEVPMGPEKHIQDKVATLLLKRGWIVLRAGFDGIPDLIAVHPSGEGKGWVYGKSDGWFLKWPVHNPACPAGITFKKDNMRSKLFLELKKSGGRISPRQKVYIRMLSGYGLSGFITSEEQVARLLDAE